MLLQASALWVLWQEVPTEGHHVAHQGTSTHQLFGISHTQNKPTSLKWNQIRSPWHQTGIGLTALSFMKAEHPTMTDTSNVVRDEGGKS